MQVALSRTVLDRFVEQATTTPEATAVVCGAAELSYRDLYERARRVATGLRARGVGVESRVGLCLPRTGELPVALLGIVMSGAAYVALDPDHPAERLRLLVEDSGAVCVVAEPDVEVEWPVPVATPAELSAELPAGGDEPPLPEVGPGNALYVVHTSGSTGRPKAVVMEHGPTARLMRWAAARYHLDGPVLQYFPITSDVCGYELFSTWWAGGCVVMAEEADRFDVPRLAALIHRRRIGTVLLPGAVLADLARHALDHPEQVATVREFVTTGDRLTVGDDLRRVCAAPPGATLDNQWGSTEVNVVTAARLEPPADSWPPVPSIGGPVSGGRIHVLDRHLQPVPVNVPGELYVGGDQLARGYLGRPDLTAQAFLPDPSGVTPGARMYRTGDLGRWRPDGTLEFLGRADFQIKIHGYRVEPGEIEAVLRELPTIGRAAVVARRTDAGPRLVAYVAPDDGSAERPDPAEIRDFLRQRLPGHMVPAGVVVLDALPTTPTGKIDRKALPEPEIADEPVETEPRNDTERRIIEVWREVLGRSAIGPHEDFFDLGGHSLLCVQVVARVGRAFGVELPLRAMFTHRTPAQFAEVVANARGSRQPALTALPPGSPRPLSFAQQRLWFLEQLQPGMTAYLLPRTYLLRGRVDVEALRGAFTTVLTRHAVLRSHFEEVAGEPMVVVDDPGRIPLETVDVSAAADPRAAALELVRRRAEAPFDLAEGPLLRAVLIRLAPEEHVLQTVIHHAVYDGLSQQILSHELSVAYRAHLAGTAADLPPLAVGYADYAAWQRRLLASDLSSEQARYWGRKLAGAPTVLELPTDRPRPPAPSYRGASVPFHVATELTGRLREIANERQVTMFMVTLAAFQVLLSRYAQTDDVVVGCPVAGRSEPELEALVGFFVNSLALRTRVVGGEPFTDLLAQVRETTLDAFAHQDLPFEQLVQILAPPRDLSRNPVIQVWFQLFEAESLDRFDLPDIDVSEFLDQDTATTTRFDLELQLQIGPDGGLDGQVIYATDLIDEPMVRRFAAQYTTLLASIAADPGAPVDRLDLAGPGERGQVLHEWNPPALPAEVSPVTVLDRFDEHLRRTPDAPAVVCGPDRWTYAQVAARAGAVAGGLRARRIGAGSRVAVCLDRRADLPVALLAVARAGAVTVPLDPEQPADRRGRLLADAGPDLLIADADADAGADPAGSPVPVVTLDQLATTGPRSAELPPVGPADGMWLTYRSTGSGQPLAVLTEHGAVARLAAWGATRYAAPPVVSLTLPAHSGIFGYELWSTWWAGGAVVLVDADVRRQPERLAGSLLRHGADTVVLPRGVLRNLLDEHPDELRAVRRIVLPGSRTTGPWELPDLGGLGDPTEVWSHWGRPEVDLVAARRLDAADPAPATHLVGTPVATARVYVLDPRLEPTPVNVPGELYVGGGALARGYPGDPGRTAGAFLPDPFAGRPGARMFRTGERGRWRPDGTLEHLGRQDHRLTIRGYRVEPEEVERVLRDHPAIADAAVTGVSTPSGTRLVAYLVAGAGQPVPEPAPLQDWLRQWLPDHLVPQAYVLLDDLPTTATGEVDLPALPAPDLRTVHVPPRDDTDREVLALWCELLGHTDIGIADNFFEIGGHSLLIPQIMHRVNKTFGTALPMRTLFRSQTVMTLADEVRVSLARPTDLAGSGADA